MNFKETDTRFGMDSAGLGEFLMVTCCELRDKPSVSIKEFELYFQVVGYYQFHLRRIPLRYLLVGRFSINFSQGICLVTDGRAIWSMGVTVIVNQ